MTEQDKLISDAAEAVEHFGEDELERYAAGWAAASAGEHSPPGSDPAWHSGWVDERDHYSDREYQ